MDREKGSGSTLHGIQALRFLAALGVVVHHVFAHAESTGALVGYREASRVAAAGVIMFFVISGFLMAMVSENARPARFLIDRATRIYPGLWLAVAIAAAVGAPATGRRRPPVRSPIP